MLLLNICICIIFFILGLNLKSFYKGFSKSEKRTLDKLYLYHIVVAVIFHFYLLNYGGDAIFYWEGPKIFTLEEIFELVKDGSSSGFIYLINYIPSKILNLSLFSGNMLFAVIGYWGFIYLFKISKDLLVNIEGMNNIRLFGVRIFPLIFFLPNLHFWSSGIGKDSILFFCIALFIYSIFRSKKRWFGIITSLIISLFIRPHISLFLLGSFGFGYILDGSLKIYQKMLILSIIVIGFISIFNYVLDFVQLESFETSSIEEFAANKAGKLNKISTGSGVNISEYPFPAKLATFLYRPFFFDINGILAVIVSLENLILLFFTVIIFMNKPFKAFSKGSFLVKGMIIYFLLGSVAFSYILGNLGIMLRQKNMLVPWLLIFGLWVIYNNRFNIKERYESPSGN